VTPGGEAGERIALRDGRAVELFASGFSVGAPGSGRFTPYAELIHLTVGPRGLRLASERGSALLPRAAFADASELAALAERLRERLAALPDGPARRLRLEALDARLARPMRPRLGAALALLCVALQFLASLRPELAFDGEYWRLLARSEPWRLVTGQLLHAGLPHLALNALGLLVLGGWLERQVGVARAGLVAAGAAAGAMLGCIVAGYESVLGASGVVSGQAGALIALELRRPDLLPAPLRLPRLLLVGGVLADLLLLSWVPNVAHAAHLGGLFAGAIVALASAPSHAARFAVGPLLSAACALAAAVVVAALGAFGLGQLDPAAAAVRRGSALLEEREAPALLLNNDAWTIAVSDEPSEEALELALRLARRAVRATQGLEPNLLDTLAEVYFQLGRSAQALETIDQAIALAPRVPYFREQRRRFLGERAPEDRPEPGDERLEAEPELEPELEPGLEPAPPSEGSAIRV
jgi:membrane associated rhomboid family serine protease